MSAFNLSIDFELGWGDLQRLAYDDAFYRRVCAGLQHTPEVLATLAQYHVPSTWGVVGGCCVADLEELQQRAPEPFSLVREPLATLVERRAGYREVLFCPDAVAAIARNRHVELASHGFLHLTPANAAPAVLRTDVAASTVRLRALTAAEIVSFIPPQNYHWPDAVFAGTGIRYVRHTPQVCGLPYSARGRVAKLARLWNDLVRPARYTGPSAPAARLLFLRIDRGGSVWKSQLRLLRRLLTSRNDSLYCFSHPHNLDSPAVLRRFAQFCEVVADARSRGTVAFAGFARELGISSEPACHA